MFTGLVQAVGSVASIDPSPAGVRIRIDPGEWAHTPDVGESIAVSGCCLTLAEPAGDTLAFDAIPETLAKTTLGDLKPGDPVNLEHAMRADALVGGHFVQGHVDGVGEVIAVETEGEWRVRVRPPAELMRFVAPKGSVTIAGVSLTVAALDAAAGWFEVALIPTTLELTTLDALAPGDRVNLEMDMIAKTVVHHLDHYANR
ncbi:MAG: riboflavin synthase [Phycisphaerales bacterium]